MPENNIDLTDALRTWLFRNAVNYSQFGVKMGYTSNSHAWNVAAPNGKTGFKMEAWGRFIQAFGLDAFEDVCRIAGVDLNKIGSKNDQA